jgi:hypothetical protein
MLYAELRKGNYLLFITIYDLFTDLRFRHEYTN